jgi:hypothetical protein
MAAFDERKKKSFDVVLDTVKLLITLSTAIIGFTVSGVLIPDNKHPLEIIKAHSISITLAIISLAICVLFCLLTILKITGLLGSIERITDDEVSINDTATRWAFLISLLLFSFGIILMGIITFKVLTAANC